MSSDAIPLATVLAHYAEPIVQTLHEAVLVLDQDLRVQVANAAFYRTFAVQAADTEGQPFFQVDHGQWDIPALRALLHTLQTTQLGFEQYEVRHTFATIGFRVLRLNARRLEGPPMQHILLTITDITALDYLIQEREILLQQAQTARTTAEATQHASADALLARETFMAVAAHELKTPLTTMLGQVQVIHRRATRQGTLTPADIRSYTALFDHGQRLSLMIDQLFDVARIQSGQVVLDRRPVSLATVLQQVVRDLQLTPLAADRTVDLTLDDDGIINADTLRLQQAMSNLVSNALKYSAQDRPVTLRLHQADGQICLDVGDAGIGIDRTELPLVFAPFYRSATAAAQMRTGLGIGLYVVKEVIEQHGGTITVTSTLGVGSTFTVCFPLRDHP